MIKSIHDKNLCDNQEKTVINFIDNPRKETNKNNLDVINDKLINNGINFTLVNENSLTQLYNEISNYINKYDFNKNIIKSKAVW